MSWYGEHPWKTKAQALKEHPGLEKGCYLDMYKARLGEVEWECKRCGFTNIKPWIPDPEIEKRKAQLKAFFER